MTPEIEALARRAVACKGWRLMPGMLDSDGWRYSGESKWAHWWWHPEEDQGELPLKQVMGTPDLSDPGTLGCLLSLVREAWRDPKGSVYYLAPIETEPGWFAEFGAHAELYATEAEALVTALETAP